MGPMTLFSVLMVIRAADNSLSSTVTSTRAPLLAVLPANLQGTGDRRLGYNTDWIKGYRVARPNRYMREGYRTGNMTDQIYSRRQGNRTD